MTAYSQLGRIPARRRNDRRHVEPAVRDCLRAYGGSTVNEICISVPRDRTTIYRCLLRMKKRGQVTSQPLRGHGNPHIWRLV